MNVFVASIRNESERKNVISEFEMDFKKSSLCSSLNSTDTRSKKGYGFKRPGLKTGGENTREDKGDREGIPHTHPIPQVIRLELFLESG